MAGRLLSVGHSNEKDRFYSVLCNNGVDVLADVRSHPTSRLEWARKDELQADLAEIGIEYLWLPELGGWTARHQALIPTMAQYGVDVEIYTRGVFPKQRIARQVAPTTLINTECPLHGCPPVRPEKNRCSCMKDGPVSWPFWYIIGFRDYSYYMMLPEFVAGVERLHKAAYNRRVATCCQEYLPHKCHRSMIADYSWHILGVDTLHLMDGRQQEHSEWPSRLDRYDRVIRRAWMDSAEADGD